MNKKKLLQVLSLIIYVIAIGLSLYWYDWKLIFIILLFIFANNIERHVAEIINSEKISKDEL